MGFLEFTYLVGINRIILLSLNKLACGDLSRPN